MIKTAIILAAGKGSRLRPTLDPSLPKGALTLNDVPIIEQSIQTLLGCGISSIIIGTGHGSEWYENLAKTYPEITCVYNPDYEKSGSMHTLSLITPFIQDAALLLESDLIYEKRAIDFLLAHPDENIILSTGYHNYTDEVFVLTDNNDQLKNMTKASPKKPETHHVLAGISKCSHTLLSDMSTHHQNQSTQKVDYEDALIANKNEHAIYVIKNDAIAIMEIDNDTHLQHAKTLIKTISNHNKKRHHERKYLLNPGPATTSWAVKQAQVIPDICPRESELNALSEDISHHITKLASQTPEKLEAILFGGSGTASVESMLSSVMNTNDHALIINQGAYGERMAIIAKTHQLTHTVYAPDPLSALSLSDLDKTLSQGAYTHLVYVHHETSTGLLNDVTAIGKIAQKHNLTVCVDAMSSFGAINFDMINDHIHFCTASSNKNIQGMAGVSFVIAQKDSLNHVQSYPKRSVYLDLFNQYDYAKKNHQFQFTPPVQTLYALCAALHELAAEGVDNRYQRYISLWEKLHHCISNLGFKHLIDIPHHGKLITAYIIPEDKQFSFDHFHDFLYRRHITVYPGKEGKYRTFRLANIGDLTVHDMTCVCKTISDYFNLHPL